MNAHERAEKLCIEAEKLGLCHPTERMIADAIVCAESDVYTDIVYTLSQLKNMQDAADTVERWKDRQHLDLKERLENP